MRLHNARNHQRMATNPYAGYINDFRNLEEIDVQVEYDYQPYEAGDREYPGCDASVEVTQVTTETGEDITDELNSSHFDSLELQIWSEFDSGADDRGSEP